MFYVTVALSENGRLWATYVAPMGPLGANWKEEASVACNADTVFAGSRRGVIKALDAATGKKKWKVKAKHAIPQSLAADDKAVYLGLDNGVFNSYGASDGALRWSLPLKSSVVSAPTISNGLVYFITGDNTLYAVDTETGKWKWTYTRDIRKRMTIMGAPRPVISGDTVYMGTADGLIAALNSLTGELLWGKRPETARRRFEDVDSTPLSMEKIVYLATYDGKTFALDEESGNVIWNFDEGSIKPIYSTKEGALIVSAQDNYVHALNLNNGQEIWKATCRKGKSVITGAVVVGDRVVFCCDRGHVHVVSAADGKQISKYHTWGAVYSTPVTNGNKVFIIDGRGEVEAFGL